MAGCIAYWWSVWLTTGMLALATKGATFPTGVLQFLLGCNACWAAMSTRLLATCVIYWKDEWPTGMVSALPAVSMTYCHSA